MYSILAAADRQQARARYGNPSSSRTAGRELVTARWPSSARRPTEYADGGSRRRSRQRHPATRPPYNPLTDFVPLALIARRRKCCWSIAELPVRSIDDLVKLARSKPGGLSFGSAGPGTGQHLNGEQLKSALGIGCITFPTRASRARSRSRGGHIDLMSSRFRWRAGRAKAGACACSRDYQGSASALLPDVPPLAEIGVSGYAALLFMLVAPQARRRPRHKLHADLRVR